MTLLEHLKNTLTTPAKSARDYLFTTICSAPDNPDQTEYRYNYWQSGVNAANIASDILKIKLIYDFNGNMKLDNPDLLHFDHSLKRYFTADLVTNDNNNIYNPKKLYIILLHDYSNCYESFEYQMYQLANSETNVIGFNPTAIRIKPSITQNPNEYQAAIRSIIDNLHNKGVPFDNIVIMGHGFGASIATVVAAEYQEKNQRVKVFADRAFSDLAMLAGIKAYNAIYEYLSDIPIICSVVSFCAYYLANATIRIFGLNIDATQAFTSINRLNPGDAKALFVFNDQEIPEYCSLARSLTPDMLSHVAEFKCGPKLKAHYVNARDLTKSGEPIYARHSGTSYVNACLDHFKERMLNPGLADSVMATKQTRHKEASNILAPVITYAKDLYTYMREAVEQPSTVTHEPRRVSPLSAYSLH